MDGKYAGAHVGLAETYWQYINFGYSDDASLLAKAIEEIDRALSLDRENYTAYLIRTKVLLQQGNIDDAIVSYKKAVQLAPTAIKVVLGANQIYKACGLFKRAEMVQRRLLKYTVNQTVTKAYIAHYLMLQGKFIEARDLIESLFQLEPANDIVLWVLGQVYYFTGQFQQSADIGESARKAHPGYQGAMGLLAKLSAAMDKRVEALEYVKAIEKLAEVDADVAYDIASTHARLGDEEKTIIWLKRVAALGHHYYLLLTVDPSFNLLRSSLVFKSYLESLRKDWERYRDLKFFDWEED